MTRNPKTVVANDNETSVTLAMRLVQTEERYEAAQLAEADARQLYARTRTEADHSVAFSTWCERNYLGHEIEKLAAAGAARLRDEQAMPRARAARARSRWAEWMARTCPDTRWRDSHFPDLIGMRPESKPRLDGLPLYQSPEWRRLEALGQRHLKVWRASLDAEKLAPKKQKMKEAFGKKTPDQDSVWVNAQVPSRPKQSAEQGKCYRLWTEGQLKAKLAAELDSHELSRDWDGLKEEQVAYAWVMGELLAGREVYRHKLDPKHWAVLSKVHKNGAVLLACNDDTIISAYSDPDIEPDEDREEPHPWPSYPGCPADRHPKAGKYLGAKGADAVIRAWRAMNGERTFDKAIAEWINTRREMLGFTENDRHISVENCGRIRRELVEAGRLIQKLAAEHYRREHVWRTLAAACRPADEPDKRAGGKMSKAEVDEAALLRVVLERTVGDLVLPDAVTVVAAANPPDQAAGGWDLSAPLANRLCHLDWDMTPAAISRGFTSGWPVPAVPVLPDWWQIAAPKARHSVGEFLAARPDLAVAPPPDPAAAGRSWPSPRTWEMAAVLLTAAGAAGASEQATAALIFGAVGQGAGSEFMFWQDGKDLPDPEAVLASPLTFKIPERTDRVHAALSAVVAAVESGNTRARRAAAWKVIDKAAEEGIDVAAAAALRLQKLSPPGEALPAEANGFRTVLRNAQRR